MQVTVDIYLLNLFCTPFWPVSVGEAHDQQYLKVVMSSQNKVISTYMLCFMCSVCCPLLMISPSLHKVNKNVDLMCAYEKVISIDSGYESLFHDISHGREIQENVWEKLNIFRELDLLHWCDLNTPFSEKWEMRNTKWSWKSRINLFQQI